MKNIKKVSISLSTLYKAHMLIHHSIILESLSLRGDDKRYIPLIKNKGKQVRKTALALDKLLHIDKVGYYNVNYSKNGLTLK